MLIHEPVFLLWFLIIKWAFWGFLFLLHYLTMHSFSCIINKTFEGLNEFPLSKGAFESEK